MTTQPKTPQIHARIRELVDAAITKAERGKMLITESYPERHARIEREAAEQEVSDDEN